MQTVKEKVHSLAESLQEDSTWDDVMYQIYVRKKIEAGLEAVDKGDFAPHDEVKKMFSK